MIFMEFTEYDFNDSGSFEKNDIWIGGERMSLVYKCDRCGEIIPDSESVARKFVHRNVVRGNIIFDVFYGNNSRATIDQFNREITLCKECDDSFIHWFQSGKEADVW